MRATYSRTKGVRHLFAAYELGEDKLYGHIKPRKTRARFLEFCRYLRSLYPLAVRIAIICDNFSPHLSTRKDKRVGQWAATGGKHKEPGRAPRRRMRATYTRTAGVRHLFAALELGEDKLFGHIKPRKTRARFLEFCRYLRSLYPPSVRIAIICDNFSPHLSTRKDQRVGTWAKASNVEIAYTPTNSSWLNRIEAQFTALRYFTLDGTDHPSHKEQASMIRRYIIWRNNHAYDERLRRIVDRANVA